jgi:dUTP pyrophosphatase
MQQKLRVKIKKLNENVILPEYQTNGSAGFDFHAIEDMEIDPRRTVLVKTGLSMEIPEGYELQVRPRSGMSLKTKMRVANSPGTIDSKN